MAFTVTNSVCAIVRLPARAARGVHKLGREKRWGADIGWEAG
jgi:hypothetical protein